MIASLLCTCAALAGPATVVTGAAHVDWVWDDTNQRMGIGTTTPKSKLDVEGSCAIGATYSGTTAAPTNGLIVEGNVGIGQTTFAYPDVVLDVIGGLTTKLAGANERLMFGVPSLGFNRNTITGDLFNTSKHAWQFQMFTDYLSLETYDTDKSVINAYSIVVDENGYVGIGVNPTVQFHVLGVSYFQGNVGAGVSAPKNPLDVEGGAVIGATYSGTNTAPSNGLLVEGNVGIGVTSPQAKLSLGSDITAQKILTYDSGNYRYGFGIQSAEFRQFCASDGHLSFGTVSTSDGSTWSEKVRIENDGDTGIGTTTPASKLDVEGGVSIGATYSGTTAAPTNGAIIEGKVGIGSNAPTSKLYVNGNLAGAVVSPGAGTYAGYDVSGAMVVKCTAAAAASCDFQGFASGVAGQLISVVDSGGGDVILRNGHGSGTQKIITGSGADLTIATEGGATLVFDGTYWWVTGYSL